jgi:hypothetical protein
VETQRRNQVRNAVETYHHKQLIFIVQTQLLNQLVEIQSLNQLLFVVEAVGQGWRTF